MGVYHKFVNLETKERIEIGKIGGGGIKHFAVCNGDPSRLFTFLHMLGETGWRVVDDTGGRYGDLYYDCKEEGDDEFCTDVTEKKVAAYNERFSSVPILFSGDDE